MKDVMNELRNSGAIIPDGTWLERFLPGLLSSETAAQTAKAAIHDNEYCEVLSPIFVMAVLYADTRFPRSGAASALREVWLKYGISGDVEYTSKIFHDLRRASQNSLMSLDEIIEFENLPSEVTIYRGQLFSDGKRAATGMSWTLDEQVAQWYAAPVPHQRQPHGWVLSATVPKRAVLAMFLERGEREVVVDTRQITKMTAKRGTADHFPEHLMK